MVHIPIQMNMRKLLLLTAFILISTLSFGQNLSVGGYVGLNNVKLDIDDTESLNGINMGFNIISKLNRHLYLESGISFNTRGYMQTILLGDILATQMEMNLSKK